MQTPYKFLVRFILWETDYYGNDGHMISFMGVNLVKKLYLIVLLIKHIANRYGQMIQVYTCLVGTRQAEKFSNYVFDYVALWLIIWEHI